MVNKKPINVEAIDIISVASIPLHVKSASQK